jgi:hypothetical protein
MAARTIITLSQLLTYCYDRLGNQSFWTQAEVTKLINEALRTWNCLTGYWHGRIQFTTTANRIYYPLPAALVFGAHVELNGNQITESSVFNWDQAIPDWEASRDTPEEWSPVGIGIIALRPIDPVGNLSIVVDGVSTTPVLVNLGDFIDIGQEDFKALLDYIEHLGTFKEGGAEFDATSTLMQSFMRQAGVRNEKLRATSTYRRVMGLDEDLERKPIRVRAANEPQVGVR